jgi:hypothetical protein
VWSWLLVKPHFHLYTHVLRALLCVWPYRTYAKQTDAVLHVFAAGAVCCLQRAPLAMAGALTPGHPMHASSAQLARCLWWLP